MKSAEKKSLRETLYWKQHGLCSICKGKIWSPAEATLDHWKPRSHGGQDKAHNLRVAHKECNAAKANRWHGQGGAGGRKVERVEMHMRKLMVKKKAETRCGQKVSPSVTTHIWSDVTCAPCSLTAPSKGI